MTIRITIDRMLTERGMSVGDFADAIGRLGKDGVAARVEVEAERQGLSTLALGVRVFKSDGKPMDIRFPDAWSFLQ